MLHRCCRFILILGLLNTPWLGHSQESRGITLSSQSTLQAEDKGSSAIPKHLLPYVPLSERFIADLEAEEKLLLDKRKEFVNTGKIVTFLILSTFLICSWICFPLALERVWRDSNSFVWLKTSNARYADGSSGNITGLFRLPLDQAAKYVISAFFGYFAVLLIARYRSSVSLHKPFLTDPMTLYQATENTMRLTCIQAELKQRIHKIGQYVTWRKS